MINFVSKLLVISVRNQSIKESERKGKKMTKGVLVIGNSTNWHCEKCI